MKKTLRNRPLDSSLVLINQKDYKVYGDLVITGSLIIINSTINIKGNLKIIKNKNLQNQVLISNSKVFATSIESEVDITINGGFTRALLHINCMNILGDTCLSCGGDITVEHNSYVERVIAKNYYVGGNNYSKTILCSSTVVIFGDNNSNTIWAKRLHIGGDTDFNNCCISVDCFTSNGHVRNCYSNIRHIRNFYNNIRHIKKT